MRITGTGSAWNDAAIIFGYQDANNYYYVSLNESNDGNTKGLIKVVGGSPTELDDIGITVTSDTDYAIEIERSGSSISVSVNSSSVASATDSTFTSGKAGLGSYNDGASFDNLIVSTPDTVAPSVPTGLTASNESTTTVDLDWNASTDNVGVTGYNVYTNGSSPVAVSTTSVTVAGLSPNTSYTFSVSAYDAASNESAQSSGVSATTNQLSQVAAPSLTPAGGTYTSAQSVSISTTTSGSTIRYTTNGSNPTSSSGTVYSSPISVSSSQTVKAIAYQSGYLDSSITTEAYTINLPSGTTLDSGDGFYNQALSTTQTGTFTAEFDATPSTNPMDVAMGLSPSSASAYSGMAVIVRFNTSGNIDARDGGSYTADNSITYSASTSYHFRLVVDIGAKTYSAFVTPQGGSEATIGTNYDFRSDQSSASSIGFWTTVVESSSSGNVTLSGFTVNGSAQTATPTFSPTGGTYSSTQNVSISSTTSGATIRYTADGSTPTSSSGTVYSSPVSVSSSMTLKAIAYASGLTDSNVGTASYTINTGSGNSYYVDPSTGNMSNPGTSSSPWSTLAAVFTAGKTFSAGDTIYLRDGNHGFPVITADNTGDVTITNDTGHSPIINRIDFNGATHWVLDNVDIYTSSTPPESPVLVHPVYPKYGNSLVRITGGSTDISLTNCSIYSIADSSGWDDTDWNYDAWNGIYTNGSSEDILIEDCLIKNVNFGIHSSSCQSINIRYTTIQNYCGDGLRPVSNSIIEYCQILDAYDTNGNHDDAIQGFGSSNITIRGNVIIGATSSRSYTGSLQGMGFFDGWFVNWVVENNFVSVDHWHAIAFYGATNCKVLNNTVVKNPINSSSAVPWIRIFNHKNGSASTGNLIRNNLTPDISNDSGIGTVDHNIETSDYSAHFVDYANFDFHLKSTSSAIDAGSSTQAPSIDFEGDTRSSPPDVGADEY